MAIQAVIFDLDDTLYLERDFAFSGFRTVADTFAGVLGDPDESTRAMEDLFASPHRHRVFNRLLEIRGRPANSDLVGRMVDTFRTHAPAIRLLPDAETALKRLTPTYRLGLLTDGPAVMQRAKIAALGLTGRINVIVVTDELGPGWAKPSPRAFKHVASELAADHHECAYVADNPAKDFVAPNALGWLTVRIMRDSGVYRAERPPAGGAPAKTVDSLDHLDDLLGRNSIAL